MTKLDEPWVKMLGELSRAGVEFIVIGGAAAVLNSVVYRTEDIDIVHRRDAENIERLMAVLERMDAHFRNDMQRRKLRPRASDFRGHGHILLRTIHGQLDVLCEITGQRGYEELLPYSVERLEEGLVLKVLDLPMLITVKTEAGRAKDFRAIPAMLVALEERKKRNP